MFPSYERYSPLAQLQSNVYSPHVTTDQDHEVRPSDVQGTTLGDPSSLQPRTKPLLFGRYSHAAPPLLIPSSPAFRTKRFSPNHNF